MTISLIAAISDNFVLGKDNKLPWHMPTDQEYYKQKVKNSTIIMGRKTAESTDMFFSSIRNILITRDKNYKKEGFEVFQSLDTALESCEILDELEVFITGGEQIYKMGLTRANKLYITRVHGIFEGDAFFPEFSTTEWSLFSSSSHQSDSQNPYPFTFEIWVRK